MTLTILLNGHQYFFNVTNIEPYLAEDELTNQEYLVSLVSILNTPIGKCKHNETVNYCVKRVLEAIENGAVLTRHQSDKQS